VRTEWESARGQTLVEVAGRRFELDASVAERTDRALAEVGRRLERLGRDLATVERFPADVRGMHLFGLALGERAVRRLREHQADTVGVTIGRFQPFTAGHGRRVRGLASQYGKGPLL